MSLSPVLVSLHDSEITITVVFFFVFFTITGFNIPFLSAVFCEMLVLNITIQVSYRKKHPTILVYKLSHKS